MNENWLDNQINASVIKADFSLSHNHCQLLRSAQHVLIKMGGIIRLVAVLKILKYTCKLCLYCKILLLQKNISKIVK